jgi:tetratricopeptide (TPR) repeat protein
MSSESGLETIVRGFEAAWLRGQRPDLDAALAGLTGAERSAALVELVHAELELRLKAGEPARVEDYLHRYPELSGKVNVVKSLIEAECQQRRRDEPDLALQEFQARFPELASPMPLQQTALSSDDRPGDGSPCPDGAAGFDLRGYELLNRVGRGGMGEVFRGLDPALGRDLAVKVLRPESCADPEAQRRFTQEARVTGALQHPNIVPVHNLGRMPDGRLYFTMKLVRGRTLAELLAQGRGPERLPELLGVFEKVCQAVAFAHSRGVIHRDLKPSNVMVGAFGEVQVMDWGLAKALRHGDRAGTPGGEGGAEGDTVRRALLTGSTVDDRRTGVVGTPQYMAPEQARGEGAVDERADVFGLGAILCEILTGKPPFLGATLGELLRQAAAGDTADALARLEGCGADAELVALCRECLAAEYTARPRSGGVVAERFLTYQAGVQERLRKAELEQAAEQAKMQAERRRQRMQLILAGLIVVFTAAAGAAGVWYVRDQANRAAEDRVREAEQAARRDLLEGNINTALDEEGQEQQNLHKRLTDPREFHKLLSKIDSWGILLDRRAEILKRAAQAWASGQGQLDAALQERLRRQQAQWDADRKDFALARKLDDIRLRAASSTELRFDILTPAREYDGLFADSRFQVRQGDVNQVAARIQPLTLRLVLVAALDNWAEVTTEPQLRRRLLAVAKRVDPEPWRDQVRDAISRDDQGKLQELARRNDLGEQPPQLILLLSLGLPEHSAVKTAFLQRALSNHPDDFWLPFYLGSEVTDSAESIGCYRAAVAIRPQSYAAHLNLGAALSNRGDLENAITEYRQALTLNPKGPMAHNNLANALRKKGDLDRAISHLHQALRVNDKFALAHSNLGAALKVKGDLQGALKECRRALALDDQLALAHGNLGAVLKDLGDLEGAITHYQRAIKLDPKLAAAHADLGSALKDKGNLEGAIQEYHEAIALAPKVADAYFGLGNALKAKKDLDGAITQFKQALALNPRHAKAHNNLGNVLLDKGDLKGAITQFQQAIALDPKLAIGYLNLGNALYAQGDRDGAIANYRQAIKVDPKLALGHFNLGLALYAKGDLDGAMASYRQTLTLEPNNEKAHVNLGAILHLKDDLDGAIAEYRQVLTFDPKNAKAYLNLGNALSAKGDLDGAIAQYRKALTLEPDLGLAHCGLGQALLAQGHFTQARQATTQALKLLPPDGPHHGMVQRQLEDCQRLLKLEARLPSLLKGDTQAEDALDRLQLADFCGRYKKLYVAATQFYRDAFAAGAALTTGRAYDAARAAARAAAGQSADAGKLNAKECLRLRQQAREWLREALQSETQRLKDADAASRERVRQILQHWMQDSDLATVRDAKALAKLPEAERAAWQQLWADVATALAAARKTGQPAGKKAPPEEATMKD